MARFTLLSLVPLLLVFRACASKAVLQYPINPGGPIRTTESWTYANCGLPSDIIQLESIQVFPDPPKPGQELTVKAKGVVMEVIEDGAYADVTVKLGLIKLLQKRFDICEEARKGNASVTCPVAPGPYTVEQTVMLPKEIPRAKFSVGVRAFTAESDDLLCVDLRVDFMPFFKVF